MLFLIESIAFCAIFTLLIKAISHNRQDIFTNDYPPVVTDKLRALGMIAEKPPARIKDIIRKPIAIIVFAFTFSLLMRYVNGITTFGEAALTVYGLWLVVDWYDFLVMDIFLAAFDNNSICFSQVCCTSHGCRNNASVKTTSLKRIDF